MGIVLRDILHLHINSKKEVTFETFETIYDDRRDRRPARHKLTSTLIINDHNSNNELIYSLFGLYNLNRKVEVLTYYEFAHDNNTIVYCTSYGWVHLLTSNSLKLLRAHGREPQSLSVPPSIEHRSQWMNRNRNQKRKVQGIKPSRERRNRVTQKKEIVSNIRQRKRVTQKKEIESNIKQRNRVTQKKEIDSNIRQKIWFKQKPQKYSQTRGIGMESHKSKEISSEKRQIRARERVNEQGNLRVGRRNLSLQIIH